MSIPTVQDKPSSLWTVFKRGQSTPLIIAKTMGHSGASLKSTGTYRRRKRVFKNNCNTMKKLEDNESNRQNCIDRV
ncbi:MAG: hypothetical protein P8Q28_02105 [Luminiphilus sp.]|nr:hypothetical protein [Luminiphilus sp.]